MSLTKALGGKRKQYDGKVLWQVFMGMGRAASYKKLSEWAAENGMVNPRTGKVSEMGPNWAMWSYAMRQPEEAFEAWKKWAWEHEDELAESGIEPTWERFLKDVKEHNGPGKPMHSKTRYAEFCEKYKKELES